MSDEFVSKAKISDLFDGIYDCCDLVFEPGDHPCKPEDCKGCKFHLIKDALKRGVMSIPAAPVREVVRGKWVAPLGMCWNYACSVCGYGGPDTVTKKNFCPNCGADMRTEEGETT